MGILSNLGAKAKSFITKTFNPGKSSTSTASKVNAGVPLSQATKITQQKAFSNLVRSTPAVTSQAAKVTNMAVGMPVKPAAKTSTIQESKITGGRSKKSDLVRAQPSIPVGQGITTPDYAPDAPPPPIDPPPLIPGMAGLGLGLSGSGTTTGGDSMGWYNMLDENLGGLLPGGEKVDWAQVGVGAALLYGGYGLGTALKGQGVFNSIQGLFTGGSRRKVYRRRIGVKRSDIKRLKAMSRDLHRLDKVVNAAHIADIRFSRTTKAR